MPIKEFLQELDAEVAILTSGDFEIEVIETQHVPSFDDPNITFHDLDTKKKRCKRIETCVLYVDIRGSAQISANKKPKTLAKMYSSFVMAMIECARYFGGYVRNIIGDRVMVVFDVEDCFKRAVDTAVLMNSVSQYILNRRIKSIDFKCGIGIDHGRMLITKSGVVRYGAEKEFYRGLVWLGRPANTASRLTDLAFKAEETVTPMVSEAYYYPHIDEFGWLDRTYEEFIDSLQKTNSPSLRHKNEYLYTFLRSSQSRSKTHMPILMTDAVYQGLIQSHPTGDYATEKWFRKQDIGVRDYDGDVWGADVCFKAAKEI